MRIAQIIGVSAALAASSLVITIDRNKGARSYPFKGKSPAPNDRGPVIDSTKESKRARRRRVAREGHNK